MDSFKQSQESTPDRNVAVESIKLSELQLNPNLMGSLRQDIRQQIMNSPDHQSVKQSSELYSCIDDAVNEIMTSEQYNKERLSPKLETLFQQFSLIYQQTDIPKSLRTRRYICANGLVISPDHCTTTIRDGARLYSFVRAVDRALRLQKETVEGKLHIVYPACGPFAPLLLPLFSYYQSQGIYSADDISLSLIDIQEGAVRSLQALVKALNIEAFVTEVVCCNAVEYQAKQAVHMVVLEAIQHGFSREGHLQMAKHFATMLEPDGLFLPQEITVGAALTLGQREYVDQWHNEKNLIAQQQVQASIRRERIDLGTILRVDLAMLRSMEVQVQDEHTQLLKCASVTIPQLKNNSDKHILLIHSKVKVFEDEVINEYDSGITHPLPDLQVCINFVPRDSRPGDLLVSSGDKVLFYYCMNGLPGFLPLKIEPQEQENTFDKHDTIEKNMSHA